jgi:hypothetical protein
MASFLFYFGGCGTEVVGSSFEKFCIFARRKINE